MRRRTVVTVAALASLLAMQLTVVSVAAAVTLTVNTVSTAIAVDAVCSLREAITAANTNATVNECIHNGSTGTDRIEFEIVGAGPHTIVATTQLPTITAPLAIDGYTDTGAAVNTNASGSNAILKITLSGAGGPAGQVGLFFNAAGCPAAPPFCEVRGLNIQQFKGDAIRLENTNNVDIFGNFIGTDVLGTTDANAVSQIGVHVINGDANDIGDELVGVATRNVISGMDTSGIVIDGSGSVGNAIDGNLIGVDATGSVAIANAADGIRIVSAQSTTIGGGVGTSPLGSCTGQCNVISGNADDGIELTGDIASLTGIMGNFIGVDATGEAAIPNTGDGIMLDRAANTRIGGSTSAARNIISGNIGNGIRIDDNSVGSLAPDDTIISGNYIGTDTDGIQGLGNHQNGIEARAGDGMRIGGTTGVSAVGCAGECNVISSNFVDGIFVADTANDALIQGNHVGVDRTGAVDVGNASDGVAVEGSGSGHDIGGATLAARNLISGNGGDGVQVSGSTTTANLVAGNYVGTDITGAVDLGNTQNGINVVSSSGNTIGGTTGTWSPAGTCSGACNLVSGNNQAGIAVVNTGATANTIRGNLIGLDVTGTLDRGNTLDGVLINAASTTTVGGTTAAARNVISGNNRDGVRITSVTSTGNLVLGNYIGTDSAGTADLGNLADGVSVSFGPGNTIGGITGVTPGGSCTGACNVISGNNEEGVSISGNAPNPTKSTKVQGNFIGTGVNGTLDLGNTGVGVLITNAKGSIIGGTIAARRNVISGNGGSGVRITGLTATGSWVQGNFIGLQTNGSTALGNAGDGVVVDTSAANNTIGGSTGTSPGVSCTGACNAISSNGGDGIQLTAGGNKILGNFIGLNVGGTLARGNANNGILLITADNVTIGGTSTPARNVISASGGSGIRILDGANNTVIRRNFIGTNAAGSAGLGNGLGGVQITDSSGAIVGDPGNGNRIANNTGDGVLVTNSTGSSSNNSIRANRLYSNTGLGIDLSNNGVTGNDTTPPVDSDSGPNGLQNFPALTTAVSATKVISGTLLSTPSSSFTVDFFKSNSCDPSGNGEGATYLGSATVLTDAAGLGEFGFGVGTAFAAGNRITATATSGSGNTSELSACVTAT